MHHGLLEGESRLASPRGRSRFYGTRELTETFPVGVGVLFHEPSETGITLDEKLLTPIADVLLWSWGHDAHLSEVDLTTEAGPIHVSKHGSDQSKMSLSGSVALDLPRVDKRVDGDFRHAQARVRFFIKAQEVEREVFERFFVVDPFSFE